VLINGAPRQPNKIRFVNKKIISSAYVLRSNFKRISFDYCITTSLLITLLLPGRVASPDGVKQPIRFIKAVIALEISRKI